jgi:hypothetical protein
MKISGVNAYYQQSSKNNAATSGKERAEKVKTKTIGENKDKIEISANQRTSSENTYKLTGKYNSSDADSIEKLKSDYETQVNDFKNMLRQMISKQSIENGGGTAINSNTSFELNFEFNLSISSTTETKDSGEVVGFGENDYWGAEQTANRIFTFATSLAGDDDKLLSSLKASVLEGFKEAEKIFGGEGKLPSVCYDTLERVNALFDQRLNSQISEEQ